MPEPRNLHRQTTGLLSVILVILGVAMIVRTITAGGGGLAFGLLMGVLFIAAGVGRIYINTRLAHGREPRER
jgi:uncharacterized protein (DUF58 family)